jgi:hypothetical protein
LFRVIDSEVIGLDLGASLQIRNADGFSTFGLIDGVSGGIYDVALTMGQPVGRGVDVTLGGRLVGGGAEVEDQAIDNWANFVSFTAGLRVALATLLR